MGSKKVKVLVISNMFPSKDSFTGIFIQIQLENLVKSGVDIISVVKDKTTKFSYIKYLIKSVIYVIFKDYDIIHAHYGFHSALIPAIFKKKPLVITFHGSDALVEPFRNKYYFFFQNYVVKKSDHIIAVSNHVKNSIMNQFDVQKEKISVISCGVNSLEFSPVSKKLAREEKNIPEEAKVVFFAGKIGFMKGLDVIYNCARNLPDVLFIIAGAPVQICEEKNCMFIGIIENRDMPLWLGAADIYFLPSRSEGTPVGILEALSCERPVVTSDVGGNPDIIKEGVNGYLIKVENPILNNKTSELNVMSNYELPKEQSDDIIKKIKTLLENENEKDKMGKNGRELILKKYDNLLITSKINDIYNKYILKSKYLN